MILPAAVAARIDEIRRDRTSGAAELSAQGAEALRMLCEATGPSPEALRVAAQALVRAQPAMAPLFTLANRALLAGPDNAAAVCRDFPSKVKRASREAALLAARLIETGATVLTHSCSSTVLAALELAQKGGRFDVICTESRPLREGVTLARRLAGEGIAVRLIIDAAVCAVLPEASLVLVGADAISSRGLVNKTGTAPLALAARHLGVPFYALCGTEKFLPARYTPPSEQPKDPAEVLAEPAANISVVNYYFEVTPLDHLTGILTEEGDFAPGELQRRLETMGVHEALLP